MTESTSSLHEKLSYSMIDRIDRICDQYERALQSDSNPMIEEFLTSVEESVREQLFNDLVEIDFDFRQTKGKVDFAEYLNRFPEYRDLLLGIQRNLELPGPQVVHASDLSDSDTMVTDVPALPQLRHFKFLKVAGTGGFGTVWRAMDLRLQREVAIKIPRSERKGGIDISESMREARVAAMLRHPNIISVHEVGEENGTPYIVTDFIDGVNLKEWRKTHLIDEFDAARTVAKLAIAIQSAHDQGIIHRDLKLANVLMDRKGEPHIADFGLAKRETCDDSLAVDGKVMGTPAYMAPEQARGDHEAIDRRTDVYSLGVILYELLTGSKPFRGEVAQLLQQILDVLPVSPRLHQPEIPKDLEAVCLKCLAKDPANRYQSAQELADDLYLFMNGETLRGIPAALPSRVWKWCRRNRRFVVILSIAVVLVASISTGLMALRHQHLKPKIPLVPVEFATDPPGCEITAVAIDPDTGEPDPAKIQNAHGRTPLTMSLEGGDYLIVAVLPNSQRFHEVYRHVPKQGESVRWGYKFSRWKRRPSGAIYFESPIRIPRPDVSVGMGFCEGIEHLEEPTMRAGMPTSAWRIPAFYIDLHEVSPPDFKQWKTRGIVFPRKESTVTEDPFELVNYNHCVEMLEQVGKRPPTAAELYYLSQRVCPESQSSDHENTPCVLPDNNPIEGLHSDAWEWTSTKPGGLFSSANKIPIELGEEAASRMIGCGKADSESGQTLTGFRLALERRRDIGVRGVRSAAPRRKQQDFISIVGGKSP